MDHRDDLNRLRLPNITDHVGVEVPESVASIQKLIMIMTDSRRLPEALQRLVEARAEAFRGIWAVRGDVQENLANVVPGLRREPKAPFHARVAFFLTRLRSSIIWRSSSNTVSPSSSSPRFAWAEPRCNLAFRCFRPSSRSFSWCCSRRKASRTT